MSPALLAAPLQGAAFRRLVERHLPAPLLEPGPHGILWWQWLALPVWIALSLALGLALARASRRLLHRATARTANTWDDALVDRVRGPLFLFWSLVAARVLRGAIDLPPDAEADVAEVLRAGTSVAVFWAALRSVDIGFLWAAESPWGRSHALGVSMLPSVRRATKLGVVAIGAVAVMAQLGYPVASLVAGLGIGGLAVALAAQKTVENLIGSVTLGLDVPFKIGDYVRVEGVEGTVEAIGLRSTRLRTPDRTVVTFPSGKLADARIETFGLRDRIRLHTTLQLVYGTSAAQLRAVLAGVEAALRAEPTLWPDDVRVRFSNLGVYSLDVEVMAWFQVTDLATFQALRQELFLAFLEIVEGAGTSFAFPTQTVQVRELPRT